MTDDAPITFSHDDYEIISREVAYQNIFRVATYKLRFRLYDGTWSKVVDREILERCKAVAVLPYDPILDRVVLIEQFRPGALSHPKNPWIIEVIAGLIDTDEKVEQVAVREAKEEAGCDLSDIYPICDYFVSPGGTNEYLHLFCGRVDANYLGGIHGLPEENENIRAFVLPADEAFILLQEGKIKTAPAIVALQWLKLNRLWLRQLWLTK